MPTPLFQPDNSPDKNADIPTPDFTPDATASGTSGLLACALLLAGLVLCCLLLQGCAGHPAPAGKDELADRSIRDAANAILADLASLNGSWQSHADTKGGPLLAPMTLAYEGSLTGALEKVCAHTGFRLVVRGKERQVPVLVHVRATNMPALHVLREIGLQTGPYERIRVQEEIRTIELVWLDPALAIPDALGPGKAQAPAHKPGTKPGRRGSKG